MRKSRNRCGEEMGKEKGSEKMKELSEWDQIGNSGEYDTSGIQDSHLRRNGARTI